jgi:predicted transcriptional regulator
MTSSPEAFQLNIEPKSAKASDFIGDVRAELARTLSDLSDEGVTKSDVAKKLGVHRSAITRRIRGTENITLRTLAEMAWAMDRDIIFRLEKPIVTTRHNAQVSSTTQPQRSLPPINSITEPRSWVFINEI